MHEQMYVRANYDALRQSGLPKVFRRKTSLIYLTAHRARSRCLHCARSPGTLSVRECSTVLNPIALPCQPSTLLRMHVEQKILDHGLEL